MTRIVKHPGLWLPVLLAGLTIVPAGCKSTTSSSTQIAETLFRADLDHCRQIELSCDHIRDREAGKPERRYEQLTLEVNPRPQLQFRQPLKKIELKFGTPRGQLRFKNVDARTDSSRQKIWFVDRDSGRIIATFDRLSGATTGPDDEPPSWATPDGGLPLEQSD